MTYRFLRVPTASKKVSMLLLSMTSKEYIDMHKSDVENITAMGVAIKKPYILGVMKITDTLSEEDSLTIRKLMGRQNVQIRDKRGRKKSTRNNMDIFYAVARRLSSNKFAIYVYPKKLDIKAVLNVGYLPTRVDL